MQRKITFIEKETLKHKTKPTRGKTLLNTKTTITTKENIPNGPRGNGRRVQDNDPTKTANTKELIKGINQAGDEGTTGGTN